MKFRWFETFLITVNIIVISLLSFFVIGNNFEMEKLYDYIKFRESKIDYQFEKYIDHAKEINSYQSDTLEKLEKTITTFKPLDLKYVKKIKKANVIVSNLFSQGSGSHIKINGSSYILTAKHVVFKIDKSISKQVSIIDNETETRYIGKVVYKKDKIDLALIKLNEEPNIPFLEISKIFPNEGSEVLVIGNPGGLNDIITDGIVSKKNGGYWITNQIYFGNSGGALLYKGKIVGVVTQMRIMNSPPALATYAYAEDLTTIKDFIESFKNNKPNIYWNIK